METTAQRFIRFPKVAQRFHGPGREPHDALSAVGVRGRVQKTAGTVSVSVSGTVLAAAAAWSQRAAVTAIVGSPAAPRP